MRTKKGLIALCFSVVGFLVLMVSFVVALPLQSIPLRTCMGDGELYLYQGDVPSQPIANSFSVNRDHVFVLERSDFLTSFVVSVNNASVPVSVVDSETTPFDVEILSFNTTAGDVVFVNGTASSNVGARAIQGYLAQDFSNPVFKASTLEVVFDDQEINEMFLTSGTYNYAFFDKYTNHTNGNSDTRKLTTIVMGPNGTIVNETFTSPFPPGTQGAVVGNFTIGAGEEGLYNLSIDTSDSVYWFIAQCPSPECGNGIVEFGEECDDGNNIDDDACSNSCEQVCVDLDMDGVCDEIDMCPGSEKDLDVDQMGCDPFQFCGKASCGLDCIEMDFKGNEQNVTYPNDCKVVIVLNNGEPSYPACVPTEESQMCFG